MTELELAPQAGTLFKTDEPTEIIAKATGVANELAQVIRTQKLATKISNREHVRVEGWTLLGTLLGVFPYTVWTRAIENGWEARCEARTLNGQVVGAAEAECLKSEPNWRNRDDYAIRSMAQTRATSKALRQPLGFVMALAGFDPTPAEEIPKPVEHRARIVVGPEVDPFHVDEPKDEPYPYSGLEEPLQDQITVDEPVGSFTPPGRFILKDSATESTSKSESAPLSSPSSSPANVHGDRQDTLPLTKPQRGLIYALLGKLEKTGKPIYEKDNLRRQIGIEYETEAIEELYRWQARQLIDRLKKACEKEGIDPEAR